MRTLSFIMTFATLAAGASAHALTLEELKRELAKRPDAQWTAADSEAAATYQEDVRKGITSPFGLAQGAEPDVSLEATSFDSSFRVDARIDWRNKDGRNWLSPIKNQGRCGSCVAFAAIATLEGQYNIKAGVPQLNIDLSEQDLFGRIGSCDYGSWPSSAMSTLRSSGVPDEACFPYIGGRLGQDQDDGGTCGDRAGRTLKIASSRNVGASGVKAALANGPLVTTMTVYEDFMYYSGGVYKHVTGASVGGHAIAIVGYDDTQRAFIVKNSWGTEWGEGGFFRISYDDTSGLGRDNYQVNLDAPKTYLKLAAPTHFEALRGTVDLVSENVHAAARSIRASRWELLSKQHARAVAASGSFDGETRVGRLDTTTVADGVYDVKLSATLDDGSESLPWFTTVVIANGEQPVTLTLDPDFNAAQPVTDRVYFLLKSTYGSVPLTKLELTFTKTDGTFTKTVSAVDPGRETKIGWRTKAYPNGTYRVSAVGMIGALQRFTAQDVTVTVRN